MLLRFPGGKKRLRSEIIPKIADFFEPDLEFREPFFGSGSIGFSLLQPSFKVPFNKIWLNDLDKGMVSLWNSVINNPDQLKEKILKFTPSTEHFYSFQKELLLNPPENELEHGFKKLAIHQMSYSGLGTKAGGPIGGANQQSKYSVDCRWSPKTLYKNIDQINKYIKNINIRTNQCTNLDFEEVIKDEITQAVLYLDPPYYVKGNNLYQHGFSIDDHIRLAAVLKKTKHHWVLSYDDCPEIQALYKGWTTINEITLKYTITGSHEKTELLIIH